LALDDPLGDALSAKSRTRSPRRAVSRLCQSATERSRPLSRWHWPESRLWP